MEEVRHTDDGCDEKKKGTKERRSVIPTPLATIPGRCRSIQTQTIPALTTKESHSAQSKSVHERPTVNCVLYRASEYSSLSPRSVQRLRTMLSVTPRTLTQTKRLSKPCLGNRPACDAVTFLGKIIPVPSHQLNTHPSMRNVDITSTSRL